MEIEIKKFSNVVCLIIFREENRKPMIISALHSGHCFHHYYPIRYCQKFIGCNAMQVWKYLLHCLREKDASEVYNVLSSSANSPHPSMHLSAHQKKHYLNQRHYASFKLKVLKNIYTTLKIFLESFISYLASIIYIYYLLKVRCSLSTSASCLCVIMSWHHQSQLVSTATLTPTP